MDTTFVSCWRVDKKKKKKKGILEVNEVLLIQEPRPYSKWALLLRVSFIKITYTLLAMVSWCLWWCYQLHMYDHTHIINIVTRITTTSKCQMLDASTCSQLLILVPDHGHVRYKWERHNKRAGVWDLIEVPPYTCLLYVDQPGDYRYQMGGTSISLYYVEVR